MTWILCLGHALYPSGQTGNPVLGLGKFHFPLVFTDKGARSWIVEKEGKEGRKGSKEKLGASQEGGI